MDTAHPLTSFDRTKPFHPLVMHYFVHILGMKELLVNGTVAAFPSLTSRKIEMSDEVSDHDRDRLKDLVARMERLLGPLGLYSSTGLKEIIIDPKLLDSEIFLDINQLDKYTDFSAGNMLILAYEMSIVRPTYLSHQNDPLLQFFRHCRNAAAHGGEFHFIGKEPTKPAVWRNLTIAKGLQGTPLFRLSNKQGFLSSADPIYLLWDIEQAYPNLF